MKDLLYLTGGNSRRTIRLQRRGCHMISTRRTMGGGVRRALTMPEKVVPMKWNRQGAEMGAPRNSERAHRNRSRRRVFLRLSE